MTTVPQPVQAQASPFYEVLPDGKWRFCLDNHRLATFSNCEVMFKFAQIENLRPKTVSQGIAVGQWWHRTMELFYREMSFGTLPTLDAMMKFAADAYKEQNADLQTAMQSEFTPQDAVLMACQYYDSQAQRDFANWKIISVEAGFGLKNEIFIGSDNEVEVFWVGKPDLFVFDGSQDILMPVDHKTVDYIKRSTLVSFKPYPQLPGYVIAGNELAKQLGIVRENDRCIVNIAGRKPPAAKPRGGGPPKPRFAKVYPNYSPEEIEEWKLGVVEKCARMRYVLATERFVRNEASCHIYGGCRFRGICSVPPSARDVIKKADYVVAPAWTPYEVEETSE